MQQPQVLDCSPIDHRRSNPNALDYSPGLTQEHSTLTKPASRALCVKHISKLGFVNVVNAVRVASPKNVFKTRVLLVLLMLSILGYYWRR